MNTYNCPRCNNKLTEAETGNGGVIYVGESMGSSEECFDASIAMFQCDSCKLTVYISEDQENE